MRSTQLEGSGALLTGHVTSFVRGAPMALVAQPKLEFFADLSVKVGGAIEIGITPMGSRRIIPILGGVVHGDGWQARVMPGGADFQVIVSPKMAHLDARYVLETEAGELIYVRNRAIRVASEEVTKKLLRGETVKPSEVYFKCTPLFETGALALNWINERLFIGTGIRKPDEVQISCFSVQ